MTQPKQTAPDAVSDHGNTGEPHINKDMVRAQYELSHRGTKGTKSLLKRQFSNSKLQP